jgi:hypothetical protein
VLKCHRRCRSTADHESSAAVHSMIKSDALPFIDAAFVEQHADASLPPASVRRGAWMLMLGSPVGRTACTRVCLRVRAARSRGGQTDRGDHEAAAHTAGRTSVEWEKACVRSKDRWRRARSRYGRRCRRALPSPIPFFRHSKLAHAVHARRL